MKPVAIFALIEGALNILIGALTPIGAHLMAPQEMSLRAAVFAGVISALVAARQWLKESPFGVPHD